MIICWSQSISITIEKMTLSSKRILRIFFCNCWPLHFYNKLMSVSPCLTSSSSNFYSCTSCDTSLSSSLYLKGSLCISDPLWYLQLAATCMLALFAIIPLSRRRSVTLLRILDAVQIAAYFKYINGFIFYRTDYLFLGMRGVNPWNEGIQVITVSGDRTVPIFTTDETYVNQLIRIFGTWLVLYLMLVIVGAAKTCCGDSKLELSTFISKNSINVAAFAYCLTIQDAAFFCTNIFLAMQLSSTLDIVFLVVAIILVIVALGLLVWQFQVINRKCPQAADQKMLYYEASMLFRLDYDLFETYSLPNLPSKEKKTQKYSNALVLLLMLKAGYGALIASKLYETVGSIEDEIYAILGYLVFSQLIWYVILPYDHKSQAAQLILGIAADLLLLALLLLPLVTNSPSFDSLYLILCLCLFGLAIVSAVLELAFDLYSPLPCDLYNVGLTIVIQDKKLQKELQRRKQEQQQNERRMNQMKKDHQKQLQELRKAKETKRQTKKTKQSRQNQSQLSLDKNKEPQAQSNDPQPNQQQFIYPIQAQQQQDQLSKYRIDIKKKRRIYDFDRKKPFIYSNKMQLDT